MTRPRIYVHAGQGHVIERAQYDLVEEYVQDHGEIEGRWVEECWVRYRGGRLFLTRCSMPGGWSPWVPFRFEPKRGNAYAVGTGGAR